MFIDAQKAVHEVRVIVSSRLQGIIPSGFNGKLTILVDNGKCPPENVDVDLRKPQRNKN